jgi:hypothetical protein
VNYRQISENLYFLLNAGARSPYESIDYQRATLHRLILEKIGELAAGWLMSLTFLNRYPNFNR